MARRATCACARNGAHLLLVSDARDGKLLVSDPYSGKSALVSERDFKDGTFAHATFGLPQATLTNYSD